MMAVKLLPPPRPGILLQVQVLSGKDQGKQGQVSVVARKLNKVIVQGMNTVSCSCLSHPTGTATSYTP